MLVEYCGPGAAGKEGELLHRFIGELFDDCEVRILVPDIEGDKSYYKISKKMPSGKDVEVMIQGWCLESLTEDCYDEKRDYAEKVLERLVLEKKIDIEEVSEKFGLLMDVYERIRKEMIDIEDEVGKRYMTYLKNEEARKNGKNCNRK